MGIANSEIRSDNAVLQEIRSNGVDIAFYVKNPRKSILIYLFGMSMSTKYGYKKGTEARMAIAAISCSEVRDK